MLRRFPLYFHGLLAALLLATAFVAVGPAQAAAPVRVMPLGDSITGSPGCWRALLWNQLQNANYRDVDFVGTLPGQGCGVAYDGDNEGHGGYLATNIANQNQLPGWLSATRPDVVVMHLGTNDVWSNIAPATILSAFGRLVDQMRASNPSMKVLVAKILPMNPSNCSQCAQRVVNLNNVIPSWAASKTTAASPITVVDQWTGFNTSTDTGDGVHPNSSGNQKIAAKWFGPLTSALNGVTPTPPPVTGGPLRAVGAGKCLDVPNASQTNDTQLAIWDCNNGTNQRFTHTSGKQLTVYGNKCLDAAGQGTTNGTRVIIWDCTGTANQQWNVNTNGTITGAQSGLCLDVSGGSTANGTLAQLWSCNNGTNQQWRLG
ncbi:RICIN domain-containing protein [Micromonospora sp. NPDC005710]|uniref:ricin-type beta-trefoil lectin domain protein n=1 Tax=Micromonospora sp. NPDC005710 TaxID=3157051 RepID=UPI003400B04E